MLTAESTSESNVESNVEPKLEPTPLEQERVHYETRLYRALQNAYGATRDRLAEALEQDDALPLLFWKREEQVLLTLLEPLIVEGLRMGMWAAGMDEPIKKMNKKMKLKTRLLKVGRARAEELARQILDRQRGWTATLVKAWLEKGEPVGALRRRLWAGPFNESYLHSLVITETTRLIAAGQLLVWNAERAGKRVIVAKRWRSGCDETCATCRPLDGKVVPLGSPFASGLFAPPAHPRCRCIMEPVWSDDSTAQATELGMRRVTVLLPAVTSPSAR